MRDSAAGRTPAARRGAERWFCGRLGLVGSCYSGHVSDLDAAALTRPCRARRGGGDSNDARGALSPRAWCSARDGAPLSFRTQAQRLIPVKVFFGWATRRGILTADPSVLLELPRAERRLPDATLTATEAETVMALPGISTVLGLRDRAILEVFWATAIRRAELANVAVHHIDRARQTLFVRHGKGARDRYVPLGARSVPTSTPAPANPAPATCYVTPRRRGCSKAEPTSDTSRNSSAMPASKPPRSTRESASTNSPKSTPAPTLHPPDLNNGPDGHRRVLHWDHVCDRRTRGRAARPPRS